MLDLCAGSGSWSKPWEEAGYRVERVTLPDGDVRTYRPPPNVWGVLAAPPCTEFSLAKQGRPRDFVKGMETVNACLRIIHQCSPKWWALENPVGLLRRYLGDPDDVWEPCDFGDQWTKRTAIWGNFRKPARGPFVKPTGSAMDRPTAALRAVTPPGFARAFFEANQVPAVPPRSRRQYPVDGSKNGPPEAPRLGEVIQDFAKALGGGS